MGLLAQSVPDERARAADRAVDWLAERGIRRVYGIPGGAAAPLWDALADGAVEAIVGQHESMCVYLACGEARATGRPGVVLVTSGPGILNTVSAVASALLDEVPLVLLAGEVRSDWDGRGAIQDGGPRGLDIETVFRPLVRWQTLLDRSERLEATLEEAWARAMQHPRGPVLVRIPVDRSSEPVRPSYAPRAVPRPCAPEPEVIAALATRLAEARKPVLLAGVGARSAGIGDRLARLAHRFRVPVVCDLEAKGVVSERDPLYLGIAGVGGWPGAARYLDADVDLLVTVGSRLDENTTGAWSMCPNAQLAQLDHDPGRMHRLRIADLPVLADLGGALDALLELHPRVGAGALLARDLAIRAARGPAEAEARALDDPSRVVRELQRLAGPGATFVSDIGNHLLFAVKGLVVDDASEFAVSGGLGAMGSGIGTAMGLALAIGGARPVVAICGDGGLLMVGNEIATCARYQVPLLIALFDNGGLGMVEHGMRRLFGRSRCGDIPAVDFVAYGRAMGLDAVDVMDLDDLSGAVARSTTRPVLARIPIDPKISLPNPREVGFAERR